MRKSALKAAIATAAVATSVALTAGSATAATTPTFTVTAGGVPTGSNLSIASPSSVPATITDTTTGAAITCANFFFGGRRGGLAVVGSGQAGTAIVRIISRDASFRSCVGSEGAPLDIFPTQTWRLDAISGNLRFLNVRLAAVSFKVSNQTYGGTCTFVLSGTIAGQYINGTGLRLPGTTSKLTASAVTAGCAGVDNVRNGDVASFKSTTPLTGVGRASDPAGGPLVMTAP